MIVFLALALAGFVQCYLIGMVLTPMARSYGRRLGLNDVPNLDRKLHTQPTPRSGGIAIFAAFWGCLWIDFLLAAYLVPQTTFLPENIRALAGNVTLRLPQLLGIFAGCTIIFVLGIADDRFNLPAKLRLVIQIAACVPIIASGTMLKMFLPPMLAIPLTMFWLVLLTNSFNFLDNMNGLTSGVAVVICFVMTVIAALAGEWYLTLIFAMFGGAVLGFWMYNFPKASIFLGDGGSTHIGFLLGTLTILTTYYEGGPSRLPVLMPLIVLGVPLFDTVSVLWIRWRENRPFMVGDTSHLSHRLVALGMSQSEAVVFIWVAALTVGLAAIPLRLLDWQHGLVLAFAIALIFFLLHWLERVSWRRSTANDASPRRE